MIVSLRAVQPEKPSPENRSKGAGTGTPIACRVTDAGAGSGGGEAKDMAGGEITLSVIADN
jgi:hypothetical protein